MIEELASQHEITPHAFNGNEIKTVSGSNGSQPESGVYFFVRETRQCLLHGMALCGMDECLNRGIRPATDNT